MLNATDIARPLQDESAERRRAALRARWDAAVRESALGRRSSRQLAGETRDFLQQRLPTRRRATNAQLTEIMMAQDFQDLTGQVIKKVVELAQATGGPAAAGCCSKSTPADKSERQGEPDEWSGRSAPSGRATSSTKQAQVDDRSTALALSAPGRTFAAASR
ncbi:MAG: protein phosphatase CheZ [Comamonadaceae bacterium]|nr:protein phosphatase CheZ [Comamonadaceae bacterium]